MDRDVRAAGAAVEAAAGQRGWGVGELAAKAEVDPGTVGDFIAGKRWPQIKTRGALEVALGWPAGSIAQIASGGDPPAVSGSAHDDQAVLELPPGAEHLTPEDLAAIQVVIAQLVDARGAGGPAEPSADLLELRRRGAQGGVEIDLHEGPDLSRVAARRGESEGRRLVEEQDTDAES